MCLWVLISLNQILSIENVDPIRPDKLCLSRQRKTERGASGLAAPRPVPSQYNKQLTTTQQGKQPATEQASHLKNISLQLKN